MTEVLRLVMVALASILVFLTALQILSEETVLLLTNLDMVHGLRNTVISDKNHSLSSSNISVVQTEQQEPIVIIQKEQPPPIIEPFDCSKFAPCYDFETIHNCYSFYPLEFWRKAEKYAPALHWHRLNKPRRFYDIEFLLWKKLPKTTDQLPVNNETCYDELPSELVYFHNFKAGGTTAHAVLNTGIPYYEPAEVQYGDSVRGERYTNFQRHSFEDVQKIYHNQKDMGYNNTRAFTFVRDPVKRFLSGLAQVGRMNLRQETPDEQSRQCFHYGGETLVKCAIEYIEKYGVYFNVHIFPQAYVMDTWTDWGLLDLRIEIAHMDDMDTIFDAMELGKHIEHARESNADGVKDKVSISELSTDTIARICKLYEIDLVLLQLLGMSDPLCPGNFPLIFEDDNDNNNESILEDLDESANNSIREGGINNNETDTLHN